MTREDNIKRSQEKYQTRKELSEALKRLQKKDSQFLKDNGYNIFYWHQSLKVGDILDEDYGTIAFAYKVNSELETDEFEVFYTIRSPKDAFSRPEARSVLAQRVREGMYNTDNSFTFRADTVGYGAFTEDLIRLYFIDYARKNANFMPAKFIKGFFKLAKLCRVLW